jgi:hypothetical protein
MKTKSNSKFLLLAILILSISRSSFAGPWPELETDQQKLSYGLALRAQVKTFFTGTYNYGMEWWNIANDQQKMKTALSGLYPKELDTRPLSIITLKKVIEKDVPNRDQYANFFLGLQQTLAHKTDGYSKQLLLAELETKANSLQAIKPGELLAALLNSFDMPKDERAMIMKASIEEKISYLKSRLPDDLSQTSIAKNSKNKFTPESLGSKHQTLNTLENLFLAERDILPLTGLAVATASLPMNAGKAEIQKALNQYSYEKFLTSQDADHIQADLSRSFEGIGKNKAGASQDSQWLEASFTKSMQKMSATQPEKMALRSPYLQLVQMSRDEAILRSAVAHDCTHTCSFTKADDPSSRIFYLVDAEQNKQIGYVEGEIKSSPEGDVLYVTSINGPTITPQQAEEALMMLHSHRQELKVQHIAIAGRNLNLFMNYGEVIHYLEKKIEGQPRIRIQSKNPRISSIIDGFMKVDYQKDFDNTEAVIYKPAAEVAGLQSDFSQSLNNTVFSRQINPTEALLFALELDATERWLPPQGKLSDGERAIVAANLNLDQYRKLKSVLQNQAHLPYEKSVEASKQALKPFGFEVDKTFIAEHPHLFYDALMAASDAVEGAHRKATLRLVTQLLKRGIWHIPWGLKQFGLNPNNVEAINQSKELEEVLKWASHDMGFHSIQLRNMALAGIGLPQLRQAETTKELFRLVAHGHMWAPDMAKEILNALYPDLEEKVAIHYAQDPDSRVRDGANKILAQAKPKVPSVLGQITSNRQGMASRPGLCSKVQSH